MAAKVPDWCIIHSIALVVRGSNPTLGACSANRTKVLHPAAHVGAYAWSIISCESQPWQPPKNNPEYQSTTCHAADSMRKWWHWCIFTIQHCRTKVFHPRKVILSLYLPCLPQCAILQRYAYGSVCSTMVLHGAMVYYVCITSDAGVMLWFTTTIGLYDHWSVRPLVCTTISIKYYPLWFTPGPTRIACGCLLSVQHDLMQESLPVAFQVVF